MNLFLLLAMLNVFQVPAPVVAGPGSGWPLRSLVTPVLSWDVTTQVFTWTAPLPNPDHWALEYSSDGLTGWTWDFPISPGSLRTKNVFGSGYEHYYYRIAGLNSNGTLATNKSSIIYAGTPGAISNAPVLYGQADPWTPIPPVVQYMPINLWGPMWTFDPSGGIPSLWLVEKSDTGSGGWTQAALIDSGDETHWQSYPIGKVYLAGEACREVGKYYRVTGCWGPSGSLTMQTPSSNVLHLGQCVSSPVLSFVLIDADHASISWDWPGTDPAAWALQVAGTLTDAWANALNITPGSLRYYSPVNLPAPEWGRIVAWDGVSFVTGAYSNPVHLKT